MGVACSLVFFFIWFQYEKTARRRLELFPSSKIHLTEIFSRTHTDPKAKALKAVFFAGSVLVAFCVWEGALWAVLEKTWPWWAQLVGVLLFAALLILRVKDYKNHSSKNRPLTLLQATLFVVALFLLTGPMVAVLFGAWFLARLAYYYRKFPG